MIAIILLLALGPIRGYAVYVGYTMLYIAAALTLWSMVGYLRLAWPDLSSGLINEEEP